MNDLLPTKDEFATLREVSTLGVKSGYLPESIKTPEQAIVIALKGRELGIPPMHAFSSIAIIKGRPTISAELALALIFRSNPEANIRFVASDDKECVIEASRRAKGDPSTFKFSMDDAKRANLLGKTPWQQYPTAMLRARCVMAMARAVFPDALMGCSYTPEELETAPQVEKKVEVEVVKHEIKHEPQKQAESKAEPKAELRAEDKDFVTDDDVAKLTTLAKSRGWWLGIAKDTRLKDYVRAKFGANKVKDLTPQQFSLLSHVIATSDYYTALKELDEDVK